MSPVVSRAVGEIFHVFNRGVDKRIIFNDKQDYLRFYESLDLFNNSDAVTNLHLARIQKSKSRDELVEVLSYCLLPNHFHLLLRPIKENGLGEFMRRVGIGYTNYFNERYERNGVLFQGTFKRVVVESDAQLNYLFAYVNENHLVHGLVQPKELIYSSKLHFTGKFKSKLIKDNFEFETYDSKEAIALALEIFSRRKALKSQIFD